MGKLYVKTLFSLEIRNTGCLLLLMTAHARKYRELIDRRDQRDTQGGSNALFSHNCSSERSLLAITSHRSYSLALRHTGLSKYHGVYIGKMWLKTLFSLEILITRCLHSFYRGLSSLSADSDLRVSICKKV